MSVGEEQPAVDAILLKVLEAVPFQLTTDGGVEASRQRFCDQPRRPVHPKVGTEERTLDGPAGPRPTLAPERAEDLTGLPPAYIAVAGHDPLRDDGARYAELLTAAGVPVELHNAETLIHGYLGYAGVVPAATEAAERALSALREALHR
jgi:acetyl esterase/lipase